MKSLCLGVLAIAVLCGCVQEPEPAPQYAFLVSTATTDDALPSDLPDDARTALDTSTARFVASHDGEDLWLAKSRDQLSICILAYVSSSDWVVGCGGGRGALSVTGARGDYLIQADGVEAPEGYKPVAQNVYVQ